MSPFMERTLLLVAFLACLHVSTALMCYDCNSEYDRRCGDPFDPYSIGEVNCSKQEPREHLKDKVPVLCRKTVQKVYGKVRIVRGCGYIRDNSTDDGTCLKRSGTHDVQAIYCACTTDLCNHATSTLNNNNYLIHLMPYTLAALFIMFSCKRINLQLISSSSS
ncbi:uncharacterized protein LOC106082165 [Stomoxys calcitrans]|uniref:Protein quiver n=1 Tax=Stomoxys calcitrans TaxID=35570 RepID=A0A1I8P6C0_STOCA|nr:uncharacterized protein LOC106082165 [Stomoxys calcitrans]XP_013099972.1 uncharacterized protein LOC106082165 [Stomoxys calcitrans]XP_013099973.1 uncharacterized protein LOC106082165 [Stomoxys calcitrans]XP_059224956.1 uncharacterized protein LOC106082165 [Stomoxys calcitrans]